MRDGGEDARSGGGGGSHGGGPDTASGTRPGWAEGPRGPTRTTIGDTVDTHAVLRVKNVFGGLTLFGTYKTIVFGIVKRASHLIVQVERRCN